MPTPRKTISGYGSYAQSLGQQIAKAGQPRVTTVTQEQPEEKMNWMNLALIAFMMLEDYLNKDKGTQPKVSDFNEMYLKTAEPIMPTQTPPELQPLPTPLPPKNKLPNPFPLPPSTMPPEYYTQQNPMQLLQRFLNLGYRG